MPEDKKPAEHETMIDVKRIFTLPVSLQRRITVLNDLLVKLQPGIIAVSGGLDSRLLAALAKAWELDYRAAFLSGPHLTPQEAFQGRLCLEQLGLPGRAETFSPLENEQAAQNSVQRCYFCKKAMIKRIRTLFQQADSLSLLEGSHASDQESYRPGALALHEEGVCSPLAQAGLNKSDLRTCAHSLGLADPEQPSRACLMTRFAYGISPDEPQLTALGQAEDELRVLGLRHFRIRIGPGDQAWLQVDQSDAVAVEHLQKKVQASLARSGFAQAELLICNGVSGFFDQPPPG